MIEIPKNPIVNNNLTMRDYFAKSVDGEKLAEGFSSETIEQIMGEKIPRASTIDNIKYWLRVYAKFRYMMADAMLEERYEEV